MTLALSIPNIHSQLARAETPKQTKAVESVSRAAMAYAKEQEDYSLYMQAWQIYLSARRKTTELVKRDMDGNIDVTAEVYGFTKMQWSRRLKELAVEQDKIDAYFDKLVSYGWQPSIAGLLRESDGTEIDREARAVVEIKRATRTLKEYGRKLDEIHLLVAEAFFE